jgi:hypothetical protein
MKIILHIGVPKTGTTAIQAHIALNRGWFEAKGVAIPQTGHSAGFGHVLLFEDQSGDLLTQLSHELDQLEKNGFHTAILSWEGLNTFNINQIKNIHHHISKHATVVLAYLREQAEVIQSGYFQAVKQNPQRRTIDSFSNSEKFLSPPHIYYDQILDRFASFFGTDNIRTRVYEKELLVDKNIVVDFLSTLALIPDETFIKANTQQNISLDVGSAYVMNIIDSFISNTEERENIIDLLLTHVTNAGFDEKYFLSTEQVLSVKRNYSESNLNIKSNYPPENLTDPEKLFSHKHRAANTLQNAEILGLNKFKMLNDHKHFRSWRGELLKGKSLQKILPIAEGWSTPESWGIWSDCLQSTLKFRILTTKTSPHHTRMLLTIKGKYFSDHHETIIKLPNGEILQNNLSDCVLEIHRDNIDEYGELSINIKHIEPVSPKSMGISEDSRKLAIGITEASYVIVE